MAPIRKRYAAHKKYLLYRATYENAPHMNTHVLTAFALSKNAPRVMPNLKSPTLATTDRLLYAKQQLMQPTPTPFPNNVRVFTYLIQTNGYETYPPAQNNILLQKPNSLQKSYLAEYRDAAIYIKKRHAETACRKLFYFTTYWTVRQGLPPHRYCARQRRREP